MKKIILLVFASLIFYNSYAQDTKDTQDTTKKCESSLDFSVDLMSRYVWRGTDFGKSPSFQPCIEYSLGNFVIGAWGAYTTNGNIGQESDLYLSYTFKDAFTIMVTDYFFPNYTLTNNNYFEYGDKKTGHIIETGISFNGTDDIPISFFGAVNVYGADKYNNGDKRYSTYLEVAYNFENNNADYSIILGGTPDNPKVGNGETGFYGNTPGVINVGISASKEIKVSDDYNQSVSCSLITNPQAENIFFVFGFSF